MATIEVGQIFDGRSLETGPWRIELQSGRIRSIEMVGHIAASRKSLTALPGLIDAHVHLMLDAGPDPISTLENSDELELTDLARSHAKLAASFGVAVLRDCGSPATLVSTARAWAARQEPLPRVLVSGVPVTTEKGHCHFFRRQLPSEPSRLVDLLLADLDVDFVKVMVTGGGLTPGSDPRQLQYASHELCPLVEQASAAGRYVAAHVHTEEGIESCLDAGVRVIEHATGLRVDGVGIRPDLIQRLAADGVCVVPTLAGFAMACERRLGVVEKANPRLAPEQLIEARHDTVRALYEGGVTVIAGTDAGSRLIPFTSLPDEISALCDAGLPPANALGTATSVAAEHLGFEGSGRVAEGYRADIVVVEAETEREVVDGLHSPVDVYLGGACVPTSERPQGAVA